MITSSFHKIYGLAVDTKTEGCFKKYWFQTPIIADLSGRNADTVQNQAPEVTVEIRLTLTYTLARPLLTRQWKRVFCFCSNQNKCVQQLAQKVIDAYCGSNINV